MPPFSIFVFVLRVPSGLHSGLALDLGLVPPQGMLFPGVGGGDLWLNQVRARAPPPAGAESPREACFRSGSPD